MVANPLGWLDDLSTAFPPYAAHSVKSSLESWRDRAGELAVGESTQDTLSLLRRQGELWRGLLTGEKRGTEMLEIENYLTAARDLAWRMHSLIATVVRRFWPLVSLAAVLILGGLACWSPEGDRTPWPGRGAFSSLWDSPGRAGAERSGNSSGSSSSRSGAPCSTGRFAHAITLLPPLAADVHDHARRGALALQMPPLGDRTKSGRG